MNKILNANFKRLFANKLFLSATAFMFLLGIFIPFPQYFQSLKSELSVVELDRVFFAYAIFVPIIGAVFCSVFIGTEYSDNTIRNKVSVGHKRIDIYFANFIVCACANLMMCAAFIIPCLIVGIPLLGFFVKSSSYIILSVVCSVFLIMAFTAIFTLISMINLNKTAGVIICIFATLFMIILGTYLYSSLEQPETFSPYSMSLNGEFVQEQEQPNPYYVGGVQREIYKFLLDFTPGGQTIQILGNFAVNFLQMILYSIFIFVAAIGFGIYFFKRKDLN